MDPSDPTSQIITRGNLFTGSGATSGNFGTIVYKWQISTDEGQHGKMGDYTTSNANHAGVYSGADTKTLTIDSVTTGMDKYAYRLDMRTPAFKCDRGPGY